MSEPKKQPEKVEPTLGKAPEGEEIKSGKKEPVIGSAPANSNDKERLDGKKEPIVGELTAADVKIPEGAKKEPVVTAPISEISEERADGKKEPVIGDASATEKPANDDGASAEAPKAAEQPTAAAADENVIPPVAVAEDSAGAPPPNDNPPADAPAPRHHGRLAKVFNFVASMAAGAAVTAAAKTAAIVGMSVAGAPAWATLAVAGLAVGVGATLYHDLRERSAKKKEGETFSGYFSAAHGKELFSKKNAKVFGISTVAALIGSALMLGFHEGVIQDAWRGLIGGAPEPTPPVEQVVVPPVEQVIPPVEEVVPPVEEVVPPVQEVVPPVEEVVPAVVCLTPGEQFANLIQGHDVSGRVTDAIARSASTNAAVAAQGAKDLAFFAFNGFDGVPKDASVAVELFKQAADAGNLQAKVDLLYMQYHGLGGLTADPQAAVATMNSLPGARAAMFVEAWGGAGNAAGATFSTDSILKGMTVGCPTPA